METTNDKRLITSDFYRAFAEARAEACATRSHIERAIRHSRSRMLAATQAEVIPLHEWPASIRRIIEGYRQAPLITLGETPRDTNGNRAKAAYYPCGDCVILSQRPAEMALSPQDSIHMIHMSQEQYMAHIVFHELAHSTGNGNRLARFTILDSQDRASYCIEEAIAEYASMRLMSEAGLLDSAQCFMGSRYADGYLSRVIQEDEIRPLAMKEAEMAAGYILNRAA